MVAENEPLIKKEEEEETGMGESSQVETPVASGEQVTRESADTVGPVKNEFEVKRRESDTLSGENRSPETSSYKIENDGESTVPTSPLTRSSAAYRMNATEIGAVHRLHILDVGYRVGPDGITRKVVNPSGSVGQSSDGSRRKRSRQDDG